MTLNSVPKWLLLVPAIGLIPFSIQQPARADDNGGGDQSDKGSNHDDGGNPGRGDDKGGKDDNNGDDHSGGGKGGSNCDVPEPSWLIMMGAGAAPVGLKLFRRRWTGSK